jgi:hypothetical protein
MSCVTVSHTTSDAYACRGQGKGRPCLSPQQWTRRGPLRLRALVVFLAFLTFLAISSPHRVHHLADATRLPQRLAHAHHKPHDHRQATHTDPPAQQPHEHHPSPSPDCVVLLLLQSIPIFVAQYTVLAAPIVSQPFDVLAAWLCPLDVPASACQARGPPAIVLSSINIQTCAC